MKPKTRNNILAFIQKSSVLIVAIVVFSIGGWQRTVLGLVFIVLGLITFIIYPTIVFGNKGLLKEE